MELQQFAKQVNLGSATELDKVRLLAFFSESRGGSTDFTRDDVVTWFYEIGLPRPNMTRLSKKVAASKEFVRGVAKGTFRLHPKTFADLATKLGPDSLKSEDVVSADLILPTPLFSNTRGFIESLAKQINASYSYNIFDGCAVLMRRLLEVLLIMTYEHLQIESAIKDASGNYFMLERIANDVKTNTQINLSRDAKSTLDEFRTLGNFSAHKIYYVARRSDLESVRVHFRATIEELLYKAGIRI